MGKKLKSTIPEEGLSVSSSKGNKFTRVHLDLGREGITLALVGAASATVAARFWWHPG